MTSRRLPPPSAPRPRERAPRDHHRSGHARREPEARIGSRIDLEGGVAMSVSPRARFGDPPDRHTRAMLCTRAAALSQVQQPAGQLRTTLVALSPLYRIRRKRRPRHQVLSLLTALAAVSVTCCDATRPDRAIRIGTA